MVGVVHVEHNLQLVDALYLGNHAEFRRYGYPVDMRGHVIGEANRSVGFDMDDLSRAFELSEQWSSEL